MEKKAELTWPDTQPSPNVGDFVEYVADGETTAETHQVTKKLFVFKNGTVVNVKLFF